MANDQELLREVLSEALEGFALLFMDMPEEGDVLTTNEAYLCSTIIIRHDTDQIRLIVAAPECICHEMAANITGSDLEAILPDMAADALNELSNITAGSWAASYFGQHEVCVLESPESCRFSADETERFRTRNELNLFMVEGYPVLTGVRFEREDA